MYLIKSKAVIHQSVSQKNQKYYQAVAIICINGKINQTFERVSLTLSKY